MDNIVTVLPASKLRLVDAAAAAQAAGQLLYQNGRALVAAARKPGPSWHLVAVVRRPA